MAQDLEQALFEMAPTLHDYSNVHTLRLRLSLVLPIVRKQWNKKKNNKNKKNAKLVDSIKRNQEACLPPQEKHQQQQQRPQRRSLQEELGESVYQSIHDLVQTIRMERNQLVGANCAKCRFIGAAKSFGCKFDRPVADLFFHTPLIEAWEKHCHLLTVQDKDADSWIRLQVQAQEHLNAFLEWKAQHFVCQR